MKMKQRKEDRIKKTEEEKINKKILINAPYNIPKLDNDFQYLILLKKIEYIQPKTYSTSES